MIDIAVDLMMARLDKILENQEQMDCAPKEICHVIHGDLDCRPVRSESPACSGATTQNQAKRFLDDVRVWWSR